MKAAGKTGYGKRFRKLMILLFWLAIWQLMTMAVGNTILMAGPAETLKAFVTHMGETDFIKTIGLSFGRIGGGFLLGFLFGAFLGIAACRYRFLEEVLQPLVTLVKAIPVASFVVLFLIWWGSSFLSVTISFFIVFPNAYVNMVNGLKNTDRKLLQMAEVFHMPLPEKILYIYRPALRPFIDSCLKISFGMSWKSGVAAEVIGTPAFSIGEKLYLSKIQLDTGGLFAWTASIILLSWIFEKLGLYLWNSFCNWQPQHRLKRPEGRRSPAAQLGVPKQAGRRRSKRKADYISQDIHIENIVKAYDGRPVLKNLTNTIKAGSILCLMAPSGEGKTTLLKLLAGLEEADAGAISGIGRVAMVFQEDRLCEELNALKNVEIIGTDQTAALAALTGLLPQESLTKPCGSLSGGMRRRAALVRAVTAESDVLLLDEPFTGLDEENKEQAIRFLLDNRRNRTVIMATHDKEEVERMGGTIWIPE